MVEKMRTLATRTNQHDSFMRAYRKVYDTSSTGKSGHGYVRLHRIIRFLFTTSMPVCIVRPQTAQTCRRLRNTQELKHESGHIARSDLSSGTRHQITRVLHYHSPQAHTHVSAPSRARRPTCLPGDHLGHCSLFMLSPSTLVKHCLCRPLGVCRLFARASSTACVLHL